MAPRKKEVCHPGKFCILLMGNGKELHGKSLKTTIFSAAESLGPDSSKPQFWPSAAPGSLHEHCTGAPRSQENWLEIKARESVAFRAEEEARQELGNSQSGQASVGKGSR